MNPAEDVSAQKQALRRLAVERRGQVDLARCEAAGRALAARLAKWPEYRAARRVGLYLSVEGEISTGPLIALAGVDGKALCLSAWLSERRAYDWVQFDPVARIGRGPFGIPQPECPIPLNDAPIDLVVAPGLGFDPLGNRLGHGKGIYDRLLIRPSAREAFKIGWGFDFQLWERIPRTERDVRLDAVMLETRDYRTRPASER